MAIVQLRVDAHVRLRCVDVLPARAFQRDTFKRKKRYFLITCQNRGELREYVQVSDQQSDPISPIRPMREGLRPMVRPPAAPSARSTQRAACTRLTAHAATRTSTSFTSCRVVGVVTPALAAPRSLPMGPCLSPAARACVRVGCAQSMLNELAYLESEPAESVVRVDPANQVPAGCESIDVLLAPTPATSFDRSRRRARVRSRLARRTTARRSMALRTR